MLLLSTASLKGYSLHHASLICRDAGFDGLDLHIDESDADTLDGAYLTDLVKGTGVPIIAITAIERRMESKMLEEIFSVAEMVGAKSVNCYPPHRLDKKPQWFPTEIASYQKKYPEISVNIVNVEPKTILWILPEHKDARPDILKKITGNTALDIGHVDESSGMTLIKTLSLMGNSIKHVYLSDRSETKTGLPLGKGTLPIESFLTKLKDGGYTGTITLDIDARFLSIGTQEKTMSHLRENREFIEKELAE